MNAGAVFGIVLTLSLFVFNYFPYTLREKYKLPYWVSGIERYVTRQKKNKTHN